MMGYVIKYLNGDYVASIEYSLEYDRSSRWQDADIFETIYEANEVAARILDCNVLKWYISET